MRAVGLRAWRCNRRSCRSGNNGDRTENSPGARGNCAMPRGLFRRPPPCRRCRKEHRRSHKWAYRHDLGSSREGAGIWDSCRSCRRRGACTDNSLLLRTREDRASGCIGRLLGACTCLAVLRPRTRCCSWCCLPMRCSAKRSGRRFPPCSPCRRRWTCLRLLRNCLTGRH